MYQSMNLHVITSEMYPSQLWRAVHLYLIYRYFLHSRLYFRVGYFR